MPPTNDIVFGRRALRTHDPSGAGLHGDLAPPSDFGPPSVPLSQPDGPGEGIPCGDGCATYASAPLHFHPPAAPRQESVGSVLYDTLDLSAPRFNPLKCSTYRLFCNGSYRPDECNMDCVGMLPCGQRMVVTTIGARVDLEGPIAEDMLHVILRTGLLQLHLGNKEYVHLPMALLYPGSGASTAPFVVMPIVTERSGGEPSMLSGGPYRTAADQAQALAGPALLPTVHGAVEVELGPGEADPLGRPSWLRDGYCRFASIVPAVEILPQMNFRVDVGFNPAGCALLDKARCEGLLRGELVVYLGGVRYRDIL